MTTFGTKCLLLCVLLTGNRTDRDFWGGGGPPLAQRAFYFFSLSYSAEIGQRRNSFLVTTFGMPSFKKNCYSAEPGQRVIKWPLSAHKVPSPFLLLLLSKNRTETCLVTAFGTMCLLLFILLLNRNWTEREFIFSNHFRHKCLLLLLFYYSTETGQRGN